MPLMDGHRLTKLIKSDEETKDIPVVIFSSLVNGPKSAFPNHTEILHQARQEPSLNSPASHAILLILHLSSHIKRKGVSLGANAQLSKPEIGNLVRVVDDLVLTGERS